MSYSRSSCHTDTVWFKSSCEVRQIKLLIGWTTYKALLWLTQILGIDLSARKFRVKADPGTSEVPLGALGIVSHRIRNITHSSEPPCLPQSLAVGFLESSYKPVKMFYTGNSGATLTRLVPAKASIIEQGSWDINGLYFSQVSWKTGYKNQDIGENQILPLELSVCRRSVGNLEIFCHIVTWHCFLTLRKAYSAFPMGSERL